MSVRGHCPIVWGRVAKQGENNEQLPLDPRTGTFHFKGQMMRSKAHSGDVLGSNMMSDDDARAEVEFTKGLMARAFFFG